MKPSIGRIVHYHGVTGTYAATVIFVYHDGQTVNLKVTDHDGRDFVAIKVQQGNQFGQWDWPPRV